MPTLTIRNIDETTKRLLRQRAARHDRSMEEEVRQILHSAVRPSATAGKPLGDVLFELSRPGVVLPDVRDRKLHEPIEL
jgi:plasmid stability protein